MVAIVLIHMVQVFLFGAYKYPRELTWIAGVVLLLMTLGMAFTARCSGSTRMRTGDWASARRSRAAYRSSATPSWTCCSEDDHRRSDAVTLFRPARVRGSRSSHRVRRPAPRARTQARDQRLADAGRIVKRDTYVAQYEELVKRDGIPFVPGPSERTSSSRVWVLLSIAACAAFLGPFGREVSRTDDHPDRAETRLLLLVALHGALVSAARG